MLQAVLTVAGLRWPGPWRLSRMVLADERCELGASASSIGVQRLNSVVVQRDF